MTSFLTVTPDLIRLAPVVGLTVFCFCRCRYWWIQWWFASHRPLQTRRRSRFSLSLLRPHRRSYCCLSRGWREGLPHQRLHAVGYLKAAVDCPSLMLTITPRVHAYIPLKMYVYFGYAHILGRLDRRNPSGQSGYLRHSRGVLLVKA